MLQSKPDSSYGLPLETGCPPCPSRLQFSLFLFLKAETHKIKANQQHVENLSASCLTKHTVTLRTEAFSCEYVICWLFKKQISTIKGF